MVVGIHQNVFHATATSSPFPVQVSFKNTVLYISPKNVQKDAANERVQFQPPAYVPPFKWQPRDGRNPAGGGWNRRFDELLEDDYFIDKSAALYHLIKDYYDVEKRDFRSVPMRLVYPRGFGKTIMLEFIKDVFSPLPELDNYNRNQEMKTKIASLEKGRELFMFGSHPVILLTAPLFFWQVNTWIARGLERAGLVNLVADQTLTPREHLLKGVTRLNAKFEEASGVRTNTIVLIDDYDFFFQDKNLDNSVLAAIMDLYLLGKEQDTGISLMVFSGRSRMVESEVNSYIDVSRKSKYHGLCGFSARELVKCANRQLDGHSKRNYDGQTFEEILQKKFGPEWNKFRFGLDEEIGLLDPTSPEGLLFSPMDAWKLVMFLLNDKKYPPSSAWHDTMGNELEFTSFANRYTSTLKGRYTLYRNLQGGWVDVTDPKFMMMSKQDYLQVGNNLQVKQVFLEAGLLTVKEVDGNMVRLGSPNWTVTKNGLTMLWDKTKQESLPMDLAYYYVSNDGFAEMVSDAAAEVNSMNRGGGESNWCKNSLDEYLFMEMLYRFRDPAIGRSKHDLHRQVRLSMWKAN
jgi:hypothetical protein